jgi:hypothetical protein
VNDPNAAYQNQNPYNDGMTNQPSAYTGPTAITPQPLQSGDQGAYSGSNYNSNNYGGGQNSSSSPGSIESEPIPSY